MYGAGLGTSLGAGVRLSNAFKEDVKKKAKKWSGVGSFGNLPIKTSVVFEQFRWFPCFIIMSFTIRSDALIT